jgi:hypothetical protein
MIYLASNAAEQIAAPIETATAQPVASSISLLGVVDALRRGDVSAIVVDQSLLDADPSTAELVWRYLHDALPIIINPAIQSADRIVQDVTASLRRLERERTAARNVETTALRAELAEPLTALLLNLSLVLEDADLSRSTRTKLERAKRIADQMRDKLKP